MYEVSMRLQILKPHRYFMKEKSYEMSYIKVFTGLLTNNS